MHDPVLAFDIGGTHLRGAVYCPATDRLLNSTDTRTPHFSDFKGLSSSLVRRALFEKMEIVGRILMNDTIPKAVSVAFPGPIDASGKVLTAPTVWGRADGQSIPISLDIQKIWPQSKVIILNDVSAAGFNYVRQSNENLCVVTVSSGIGNKVFIDGRPIVGCGGYGGEIGHWRIDHSDNAPLCECGHRGHLGALASGRASKWQAQQLHAENPDSYRRSRLHTLSPSVDDLTNEDIVEAYLCQDAWTVKLITRLACPLGQVLAGIHLMAGIERFILIGGFALALGDSYRQLVSEAAASAGWVLGANWDEMIEMGDSIADAGLLGAGRYACQAHS